MQRQLARIVRHYEHAQQRLHRLADGLPSEKAEARRDPKRWSVAECVAHLNLTSIAFVPLLESGLYEARQLGGDIRWPYRRDPIGWALSLIVGPQWRLGGRRLGGVRTPEGFVPGSDVVFARELAKFDRYQEEQIKLVRSAEDLPIDRIRIESAFDPRVRYSVYSAFVILPRHQMRHIVQAEQVWS